MSHLSLCGLVRPTDRPRVGLLPATHTSRALKRRPTAPTLEGVTDSQVSSRRTRQTVRVARAAPPTTRRGTAPARSRAMADAHRAAAAAVGLGCGGGAQGAALPLAAERANSHDGLSAASRLLALEARMAGHDRCARTGLGSMASGRGRGPRRHGSARRGAAGRATRAKADANEPQKVGRFHGRVCALLQRAWWFAQYKGALHATKCAAEPPCVERGECSVPHVALRHRFGCFWRAAAARRAHHA